ncbi:hypothetical protein PoB_007635700 [Plakobranchus ocellatus]|uniref:Uncharacterized protein n=1 Tax=Plakobranchus ocellatus TaxID=259542 RepID=A0AAV4E0M9_9GAST|nr:hypothetical protein PoB_007635700 [Plakobranchus ocellatus]
MRVFSFSIKPTRQVIIYKVCRGVTLSKYFAQERNTRSSWRTERETIGPRPLRVVFAGKRKFEFLYIASPQQGDLRLSGPPSGQGADSGARTRDRRVPADLRADSQATVLPTPPGKRKETVQHVLSECREVARDRPRGWPDAPANEILWRGDRVAMSTAAKIMRKFLRRDQAPAFTLEQGRLPPARKVQQRPSKLSFLNMRVRSEER